MPESVSESAAAVAALASDHGAHIVLCQGKVPSWHDTGRYSWPRRRPGREAIEAHPGDFGIVPWSIRTTGLDVDHGDPVQLSLLVEPVANLRTKRGRHLYCADDQPRGNSTFDTAGCRGEVRGDKGYLAFHYDGAERLLEALRYRDDWRPRDLFELVGLPAIRPPGGERTRPRRPATPAPDLGAARPGNRHNTLHTYVWRMADTTDRPRRRRNGPVDMDEWHGLILGLTLEAHDTMPPPRLPMDETRWIAYSVSSLFGSRAGRLDHSPATQAWRGRRSGEARRESPRIPAWKLAGASSERTYYRDLRRGRPKGKHGGKRR